MPDPIPSSSADDPSAERQRGRRQAYLPPGYLQRRLLEAADDLRQRAEAAEPVTARQLRRCADGLEERARDSGPVPLEPTML